MRTIRRYSNRKLYDTQDSHYVTLAQIATIIRAGDEIQVLDHNTDEDLTTATMAQIIFEETKETMPPRTACAPPRRFSSQSGRISGNERESAMPNTSICLQPRHYVREAMAQRRWALWLLLAPGCGLQTALDVPGTNPSVSTGGAGGGGG